MSNQMSKSSNSYRLRAAHDQFNSQSKKTDLSDIEQQPLNVQIDSSDMRGSNQKSSKLPHLMAHKSQGKKKKRSNTKANGDAMQEEDGNLFVQSSDAPDLKNE